MFTGLVETLAEVVELRPQPPGCRIAVRAATLAGDVSVGDSVALNGCCLTCVATEGGILEFDAGPETLARTNLGDLAAGALVNVERSLQVGARLGGHFVTGHVDTVGTLDERRDEQDWATFWFRFPPEWRRHLASKGSIAVNGVSLTLVDVEPQRFSVALIPHTLAHTTLGRLRPGDRVNLETDLLAKYVAEQLGGTKPN